MSIWTNITAILAKQPTIPTAFTTITLLRQTLILTEMDFMAHPAPFRNKLLQVSAAAGILLCAHVVNSYRSSALSINGADGYLKQQQGVLYYKNTPFTGRLYLLYANGDTAKLTEYSRGREQGTMKSWYPNQRLAQLRFFENGRKTGLHRGWLPDGKPRFTYYFENDEYQD